jgi:exodeoxyribonuclease V gamma subunit
MLPMRTIPFKVVCLMGMNHDAYPRESRRLTFDLLAQAPRPGDRSRRDDDKYLFLESLLSARRRFYISYVGQSIQDNSPLPPSVVVSELIDLLQSGYGLPADPASGGLITRHRLQAFSPDYFKKGSGLFSYSAEDLQACATVCLAPPPQPFVPEPIALTDEEAAAWSRVDLGQLAAFFANPARFFLRHRLAVRLDPPQASAEDSEPFSIEGLDRFEMGSCLLDQRLRGFHREEVFAAMRADGRLPHGTLGEVEFGSLWVEVERFAGRLEGLNPSASIRMMEAQWDICGSQLSARINGITDSGCLRYRFGKLRPRDQLELWLLHLALCLERPEHSELESVFVCTDRCLHLKRIPNSRVVLETLLDIYRKGLERPLCFFSMSSLEYARTLRATSSPRRAMAAARNIWDGNGKQPGERADPYYRRCFDTNDPLGEEFQELSRKIFDPLLAAARMERPA